VGDLGLTSARWQVLGAIAQADSPEPVARLARKMGLARQGVQRIVNELAAEGLAEFRPNPHHRRARLVTLTAAGEAAYAAASARQAPWANDLARGLPPGEIDTARALLQRMRARLEERREEP
jgi:DNA-binding MarR family transcriptional regulator